MISEPRPAPPLLLHAVAAAGVLMGALGVLGTELGERRAEALFPIASATGVAFGLLLPTHLNRWPVLATILAGLPCSLVALLGFPFRFLAGEMPYEGGFPAMAHHFVSLLLAILVAGPPAAVLGLQIPDPKGTPRGLALALGAGLLSGGFFAFSGSYPGLLCEPGRFPFVARILLALLGLALAVTATPAASERRRLIAAATATAGVLWLFLLAAEIRFPKVPGTFLPAVLFLALFVLLASPLAAARGRRTGAGFALAFLAGTLALSHSRALPRREDTRGRVLGVSRVGGHVYWVRRNGARWTSGVALFRDGVRVSGTTREEAAPRRIRAHLALLLARSPRRALLLGFGTGLTADALRRHQTLEVVDVVDADRVPALDGYFPENSGVLTDPRVRFFVEDPAVFPGLAHERFYDAVVVEPGPLRFHSERFYARLKPLLVEGGLVAQWLPEGLAEPAMNGLIAAFTRSFRHSLLVDGTLVGSDAPFRFDRLTTRLHDEDWARRDLVRLGLPTALDLAARFLRTGPRFRKDFETGGPGGRDRNLREVLSELQITDADLADSLRDAEERSPFP
ncbi:MAG: hypothetical protein JNK60_01160 [Acidobacteria bacterium]|nr:hypothetical protein [Acidobacteriota bacterium]